MYWTWKQDGLNAIVIYADEEKMCEIINEDETTQGERDRATMICDAMNAKPALGERSEPPTAMLDAAATEKTASDISWRRLLWLRHGCSGASLYGDDGEMQCNACMIDFRRQSAEDIERRLIEINEPKIAEALKAMERAAKE